ncbi:hypothetical protein [Acetivibrio ethanolgignens]|uniref:hypothetical protein n=1 Tax=Acetivibrio ethanolgignens TaxID=290052 RepID=UPI001FA73A9B|nr:hypothetical protein [Acetivibrio ethanolgignens]
MRTEVIYSSSEDHHGYGAGSGDTERIEYLCPCGKGKVVEEHDNIPGFPVNMMFGFSVKNVAKNIGLIPQKE